MYTGLTSATAAAMTPRSANTRILGVLPGAVIAMATSTSTVTSRVPSNSLSETVEAQA